MDDFYPNPFRNLRTAVRQPVVGLLPSTLFTSTFDVRGGEGAVVSGRSNRPQNTTADRRKIPSWIGSEKRNFLSGPRSSQKGGELYLENVPAGSFEGTVAIGEASFRFRLEIPRSDEIIVELGEILCEAIS